MIEALIVGLVASSSLLIGAVIAIFHQVQERTLGLVMAFGAGVLISAVAYNLVADALEFAGGGSIVIGLFSGAAAFFIGDLLIDRKGGSGRKSIEGQASSSSATAIVLGTILGRHPRVRRLGPDDPRRRRIQHRGPGEGRAHQDRDGVARIGSVLPPGAPGS
jgi:ZIP family zinc transporter